MIRLLRTLESVRPEDTAMVGPKAAVLGRLPGASFPVPPGLYVTTAAFRLALEPYRGRLAAILRDYDYPLDHRGK